MRKLLFLLTSLLSAYVLPAGGNWFDGWQDTGNAAAVRLPDGTLELPEGSGLVCRTAEFKPSHRYRVEWNSRGGGEDTYKLYAEWTTGVPPEMNFHGENTTKIIAGNGDWESQSFEFAVPERSNPPYLSVVATGGRSRIGMVQWRDLTPFRSDFSTGSAGWRLEGDATIGTNPVFASPALLLRHPGAAAVQPGLTLTPGRNYILTFFARAIDTAGNPAGNQEFEVILEWPQEPGRTETRLMDTWAAGIQRKELRFTVPADAPATAALRFQLKDAGSIALDQIELSEEEPTRNTAPALILTHPAYHHEMEFDTPDRQVTGRVAAEPGYPEVRLTLRQNDTPVTVDPTWQSRNGDIEFALFLPELPPGDYRLRLEQSTVDGSKRIVSECPLQLRNGAPQVGIDANRILYVDSEPFFPVSIWIPWSLVMAVQENAEARDLESNLYHLARNGVNTVVVLLEQPRLDEVFALAERFGMKIILELRQPRESDPARFAAWQEHVDRELTSARRANPALLAYLLIDEPAWGGTPAAQVKAGYDILRRIDPEHPVWINEAPRNRVADLLDYASGCDIYGCDIYPVPEGCRHSDSDNQTLSSVGEYTRRMVTIADGRKPVWMILQAFAWGSMNGGPRVFPTRDNLRFMVLDALSNGADAVSFWGLDTVDDPAFPAELFSVTRELRQFSGLLVTPRIRTAVTPEGVRMVFWHRDGNDYLLAVNPSAVTVTIRLPFIPGQQKLRYLPDETPLAGGDETAELELPSYSGQWLGTAPLPPPAWQPPPPVAELEAIPYVRERLAAAANVRYQGEKYDGGAAWIWYPGHQSMLSRCRVKREFEVAPGLIRAPLRVTADDQFTLRINGRTVPVEYQGWSCGNLLDIAPYLTTGRNELQIEAKSLEAPAGVLAELSLEYPDRPEVRILSDANWLAGIPETEPEVWQPAEVVAVYGAGAWGTGVFFIENR